MRRRSTLLALAAVAWSLVPAAPAPAAFIHDKRLPDAMGGTQHLLEPATAVHPPTAGAIAADSDRATLWANGSATRTFRLETTAYRYVFHAEADWCDGPARLEVRIDGELLMDRPIVERGDYVVAGRWGPGEHHLSFRFTNDLRTDTCDRNVHIDRRSTFFGPDREQDVPREKRIPATFQWTELRHATVSPASAGKVRPVDYAGRHPHGQWPTAELWGRGTLRVPLDAQDDDLTLEGDLEICDGVPNVEVRVDGRVVHRGPPPDVDQRWGTWGPWTIRGTFDQGVQLLGDDLLHIVEVELLDPHRGDGCQRRIRLTWMSFSGIV